MKTEFDTICNMGCVCFNQLLTEFEKTELGSNTTRSDEDYLSLDDI